MSDDYQDYSEYQDYVDDTYTYEDPKNEAEYYNGDELLLEKRTQSQTYYTVEIKDMEALREKLINECSEFTFTTRDESILIMIQFQWNINGLKDNWYNNSDQYKVLSGIELSSSSIKSLSSLKVCDNNKTCQVCFNDLSSLTKVKIEDLSASIDFDKTYFSLKCCHNFCIECWSEYCNSRLDDPLTILCTQCPQNGCNLIVPEKVFYSLTKQTSYDNLKKAILKNFTDYNKEMKWCPYPNCNKCIRCIIPNKEVDCDCGNTFCFKCGKEGHRPCQCEMILIWELKNSSESENVKWLMANTKQCPKCKKFIEKNQGCNHMTCNKSVGGCGYEFCWICLGDWKPHGSEYYNCNKFDPKKYENSNKEIEKAKFELARYSHYFSRYMNHSKAKEMADKLKEDIKVYIKSFFTIKKIPLDEISFLNTAVSVVIKARIKLKYTYVFGYYMKDSEKTLFEYQQKQLEDQADLLHELLEGKTIAYLLEIDEYDKFRKEFEDFRVKITNLYSTTDKYMDNIINHIELNIITLTDYSILNSK